MTQDSDRALEQLSKQLGQLIDITRVIDRNRDDGAYASRGNEIFYVFDTNVVQMFLEPHKNPGFSEAFHGPTWGVEYVDAEGVNTSACLLAAEYLMSGRLPGQRFGRWFMTEAHHQETLRQVQFLKEWVLDNVRQMQEDQGFSARVQKQLGDLNAALRLDPQSERRRLIDIAVRHGATPVDLLELQSLEENEYAKRAKGLRAREVCRLLARDTILETADQITRFYSLDIAGKYMSLEAALRITREDRSEIKLERDAWRATLGSVVERHPYSNKTQAGFRADCEALAMVSWAGRQPSRFNNRIVFVTGDRVLLEAYRLRHVESPEIGPYLIRPITHFVPLFNPTSADSVLTSQSLAFSKLQEALEGAMVALNLKLLSDDDVFRLRARDHFVLQVEQSANALVHILQRLFPQARDPQWVADQGEALWSVVEELKTIERMMLEAYPHLIAQRLDRDRMQFESVSAGNGEALAAAVEGKLTAASTAGFRFSVQMMPEAIADLLAQIEERSTNLGSRATVHLRLSFSNSHGVELGYDEFLPWLRELDGDALVATLQELANKPPQLFALAALLAFHLEIWKDAARFADLAASASDEAHSQASLPIDHIGDELEYKYLKAASLRFRISDFEPTEDFTFADPWAEWLATADAELKTCLEKHEDLGQLSRALRARSERAALHVSFCEWFAFGSMSKIGNDPDPSQRALTSLKIVADELAACEARYGEALRHALEVDKGENGPSSKLLSAVRQQFQANSFAAKLCAMRFAELWPEHQAEISKAQSKVPTPPDFQWISPPPIVEAYFKAIAKDWQGLGLIDAHSFTLALDASVLRGLREFGFRASTLR